MAFGLVALGLVAASCSSDGGHAGRASGTAAPPVRSCAEVEPIGDFGEVAVEVDGTPTCLLLAQTPTERARGLMTVTDLSGYPGMVFVFPSDSQGGFWMRNTPMPLSIAYLDADGAIVSTADMAPCDDDPACPSYPATGPYRFTVEVPQGQLASLGLVGDARLTITGDVAPT